MGKDNSVMMVGGVGEGRRWAEVEEGIEGINSDGKKYSNPSSPKKGT